MSASPALRVTMPARRRASLLCALVAFALAGCVQRTPEPVDSGTTTVPPPNSGVPLPESIVQAPDPVGGSMPGAPGGAGSAIPGSASAGASGGTTAEIARLEREARALARIDGCTRGQCRTAPVGHRACGGPRTYIPYCARTTDSVALFRKLDALARAEQAYQAREGMMSTCEFMTAPAVRAEAGRCVLDASANREGPSVSVP